MAIDVAVEEVADNLEELAQATRRINAQAIGYVLGGFVVGAAVGFYFGHRWNKEKIKAEVFKQSEEELAAIRESYAQRIVAAAPKPSVEEVMEEHGYSTAIEEAEENRRPLRPPVPVQEDVVLADTWRYPQELAARTPDAPYVIHQDERGEREGYNTVTYTYYDLDGVLVDEEGERPLPHPDMVVGQDNLKWGHGADHPDVVFVRNDALQLEMEICRVPRSYEEEVLGLQNDVDETD